MERRSYPIDSGVLARLALQLFDEAYRGPDNPKGTWFVDNEPGCGFLGTLRGLTAEQASAPLPPGGGPTVASHAGHLRYALSLANRAAKGEDAYAGADWSGSWSRTTVSAEEWAELTAGLEAEVEQFRRVIAGGGVFGDENLLGGTLAVIAHGAWHLGAVRQGLGRVVLPGG